MTKQRKIKNILIRPRYQLKLILSYLVGSTIIIGGMMLMIHFRIGKVQELMQKGTLDYFEQAQANNLVVEIISISMLGFLLFVIFSIVHTLVLSHRVAGPTVAIRAMIEEIKNGNYEYQRKLRSSDELQDIASSLHELAGILGTRGDTNQRPEE